MRDGEQVIPATAKTDYPGETPPEAEHHQNVPVSLCGHTLSDASVLELPHSRQGAQGGPRVATVVKYKCKCNRTQQPHLCVNPILSPYTQKTLFMTIKGLVPARRMWS